MNTSQLGKPPWLIFCLEDGQPPTPAPFTEGAERTTRRVARRGSTWGWLLSQLIGAARRLLRARRLSTAPPRCIVDLFSDVPEVYWVIQPVLLVRETPKASQSIRAIAARARTCGLTGGIGRVEHLGMLEDVQCEE